MNRLAGESDLLDRARAVLSRHYGPLRWWPAETPFEMIAGAVLTQNTAWSRVVPAVDNLRREGCLDPLRLLRLPEERLVELLRPAGTCRVKARYLREVSGWLSGHYGGDVARALSGETMAKRAELMALRGVGRETADSILLYAGGHPIFVVDAYTRRLFSRHGLAGGREPYDVLRTWFEARLPREPAILNEFHAQIVNVGKDFCRSRRPRCDACPLAAVLPGGPAPGKAS